MAWDDHRWRLVVALFWLAAGTAVADQPPRTEPLRGWASIDAEGRLDSIEWSATVPSILHDVGRRSLRRLAFSPARVDGRPRPSRTWLSGEFVLREIGAEYEVSLRTVEAGPRLARIRSPRYPQSSLRRREAGTVIAEFVVGTDGQVGQLRTRALVGDAAFARAVDDALPKWRFEPERIDGRAVASPLCVPFRFSLRGRPLPPAPSVEDCDGQPRGPLAPGQDRLRELVEVTASPQY
jgi:TonB family protein